MTLEHGCDCPERRADMMLYGIHICCNGERVHPLDVKLTPDGVSFNYIARTRTPPQGEPRQ